MRLRSNGMLISERNAERTSSEQIHNIPTNQVPYNDRFEMSFLSTHGDAANMIVHHVAFLGSRVPEWDYGCEAADVWENPGRIEQWYCVQKALWEDQKFAD